MPGTLYVVATPIGNLEDITFRALRVLREAAVIAAEDTRRTARLLQHYSISTRTTSVHEHNEGVRVASLVGRLKAGESVALVSDAGTPLLSDPGALLVSAAHQAGIRVEPVPGPSAALAVVSAAGFHADEILFVGFPPSRANAREQWFSRLVQERNRAIVFYEAPHRIRATLEVVRELFGNPLIAIGRELTKVHEELVVRPISQYLESMGEPKGEYAVVIEPRRGVPQPAQLPDDGTLLHEFGELTNTGADRREAVRQLAARYGLQTRAMYKKLEEARATLGTSP